MPGSLTTADHDAFWADGFLFPTRVLAADDARTIGAELLALEGHHGPELLKPFEEYARTNFHLVSTAAARLAHHPAVVDAVESILGPDLLVWMVELIVKHPHSDAILTVHQDLQYWGFDHSDREVTAWIALSDATIANGAMTFVRGSHRLGSVEHHDTYGENNLLSRGQEVTVDYDPADQTAVELAAGEMSLHHGLTFHGSGPNTTDEPRIALVVRFITPEINKRSGPQDWAMLVRGADRYGHLLKVAPPSVDFDPAYVSLHDEIDRIQLAAMADGATEEFGYTRATP